MTNPGSNPLHYHEYIEHQREVFDERIEFEYHWRLPIRPAGAFKDYAEYRAACAESRVMLKKELALLYRACTIHQKRAALLERINHHGDEFLQRIIDESEGME